MTTLSALFRTDVATTVNRLVSVRIDRQRQFGSRSLSEMKRLLVEQCDLLHDLEETAPLYAISIRESIDELRMLIDRQSLVVDQVRGELVEVEPEVRIG